MANEYVIGVDVGTGSVRAGVFDLHGALVGFSQAGIQVWHPQENFVEQSSRDIWSATCAAVQGAIQNANIEPSSVLGLSYDATCSLVALDASDLPVTVSPTGDDEHNIIVWMDHRAIRYAERINQGKYKVLRSVGGRISPEMQVPKLLWIKENLPRSWQRAAKFLDLADFMAYKSTGVDVRSLCTTVCKWTYLGDKGRWDTGFFQQLGMRTLLTKDKIGTHILPMGTAVGNLTTSAASDLGLSQHTKVAVGIIDAHAGALGVLGLAFDEPPRTQRLETILALVGGTSSCHLAVSRKPRFIPGIWGPYASALIPGMWLTEGGQSATGSLLDFVIKESGKYKEVKQQAEIAGLTVYQYLNGMVEEVKRRERKGPEIVKEINILPYFHGNRSPRADPTLKGMISGLTLDDTIESAALRYYATIQSVAYGTRHIIETMNRNGYKIRRIHACGGGTKNPLWLQEHADITGCEILLPKESEAVILGSAILAATGAGKYATILEAAVHMSSPGERYLPDRKYSRFHRAKYEVFQKMYKHFIEYRRTLAQF